jgi:hypothetical protein
LQAQSLDRPAGMRVRTHGNQAVIAGNTIMRGTLGIAMLSDHPAR